MIMKKYLLILTALVSIFHATAKDSQAPADNDNSESTDNKITASLGVDLVNQYIWR